MILILDIGTSSTRGILFDRAGKEIWIKQIPYDPMYFGTIYVEQEPLTWINALEACAAEAQIFAKEQKKTIRAIAYTAQRSSLIPVGEDGEALYTAIMWHDRRNASIVEELKDKDRLITSRTGAKLNTVYSATKMTWMKRSCDDLYAETAHLATISDFLMHEMTGGWVLDETYACRSLLADVRTCRLDPELCELFEIDADKYSEIIPPGSIGGYVNARFAQKTGIPEGTPVITCGGDQQCSGLGMGITEAGRIAVTAGTGAFIMAYADHVPDELNGEIVVERHALKDTYVYECSIPACAALYNWANRVFFDKEQNDIEAINDAVDHSPCGANGVLAVPTFQGSGTPDWNTEARGAFLNLTLATTREDMTRALLESIAYEIANNMEVLSRYTPIPEEIHLAGGLSRFETFVQILADTLNREIILRPEIKDPTALGAWINAALALKDYDSAEDAYETAIEGTPLLRYVPAEREHGIHEKRRKLMRDMYLRLTSEKELIH